MSGHGRPKQVLWSALVSCLDIWPDRPVTGVLAETPAFVERLNTRENLSAFANLLTADP